MSRCATSAKTDTAPRPRIPIGRNTAAPTESSVLTASHRSRGARPMSWKKSSIVAAVVTAVMAATATGAYAAVRDRGNPPPTSAGTTATIENGTLTVTGTSASENVTLRLLAGNPNTLVVDSGATQLTFDRSQFTQIVVNAGAGNDVVQIDDSNGAFTDTESTVLDGESGDDTVLGGSFA